MVRIFILINPKVLEYVINIYLLNIIGVIIDNLHVYIYIKMNKKRKEKIMRLSLIYYQRL